MNDYERKFLKLRRKSFRIILQCTLPAKLLPRASAWCLVPGASWLVPRQYPSLLFWKLSIFYESWWNCGTYLFENKALSTKTCEIAVHFIFENWLLLVFFFFFSFFRRDALKEQFRKDQARSNAWLWNDLCSAHDILAKEKTALPSFIRTNVTKAEDELILSFFSFSEED